ncbi:MAG: N-acetylmuramoyl-L-alanine amidase [Candidatus Melainabacteria bacterium]|nr:N-acetylmuramoyl-L-alanine amidase [Candidatus Melainabacteria bacterium]
MKNKYRNFLFIFLLLSSFNFAFAQTLKNQVTSIYWSNNSLTINATNKISYVESRLKEPDRLIIDILNCTVGESEINKSFKSESDEKVIISKPSLNTLRVIFTGTQSINRKSYLTNNEKILIVRIARIDSDLVESNNGENIKEKSTPGNLKEITTEKKDEDETIIEISATKPMKYNSYFLQNPDRLAIDLLNILPPESPLPRFTSSPLVSGIRVGRAASGIEATRIVIDLAKQNIDYKIDPSLLGNKLKIKLNINKEREEIARRAGIKVIIDPGHGGYDIGASYGGFEEKDINLVISEKLKKQLEEFGIKVFLTREDDSFLSLAERVEITNSIRPDVFISIHANALVTSRKIRGIETYYWSMQSQKLAYYVHRSILNNIKIPDHYIRKARFYVIRHSSSPAVLAELAFLSNYEDRQLLTNSKTQDEFAKAIAEAILKFLDIEPKKGETAYGRNGVSAKEEKEGTKNKKQ